MHDRPLLAQSVKTNLCFIFVFFFFFCYHRCQYIYSIQNVHSNEEPHDSSEMEIAPVHALLNYSKHLKCVKCYRLNCLLNQSVCKCMNPRFTRSWFTFARAISLECQLTTLNQFAHKFHFHWTLMKATMKKKVIFSYSRSHICFIRSRRIIEIRNEFNTN